MKLAVSALLVASSMFVTVVAHATPKPEKESYQTQGQTQGQGQGQQQNSTGIGVGVGVGTGGDSSVKHSGNSKNKNTNKNSLHNSSNVHVKPVLKNSVKNSNEVNSKNVNKNTSKSSSSSNVYSPSSASVGDTTATGGAATATGGHSSSSSSSRGGNAASSSYAAPSSSYANTLGNTQAISIGGDTYHDSFDIYQPSFSSSIIGNVACDKTALTASAYGRGGEYSDYGVLVGVAIPLGGKNCSEAEKLQLENMRIHNELLRRQLTVMPTSEVLIAPKAKESAEVAPVKVEPVQQVKPVRGLF